MIRPALAVFEHKALAYRRAWLGSLFGSFVLPVLYLLGIGLLVGRYVDAQGALPVSYLDYVAPGLLASTALQVAVAESTLPVYTSLRFTRTYHAMRASPLGVTDILLGHTAYVLLRVLVAGTGFLVVLTVGGVVHSARALAALPVCLLLGLATTAFASAFAASINHLGGFSVLLRFVVVPMTLFAGVYFPVESLPLVPRALAYASPLWHGVELSRAATLGRPTAWGAGTHVACLLAWCAVAMWVARARFGKRLTD